MDIAFLYLLTQAVSLQNDSSIPEFASQTEDEYIHGRLAYKLCCGQMIGKHSIGKL